MSPAPERQDRIDEAFAAYLEAQAADPAMNPAYFLTTQDDDIRDAVGQRIEDYWKLRPFFGEGDLVPEEGVEVDGYRLIAELGRGATGSVWEAEEVGLKRRVALKLLYKHRVLPTDRARFGLEAEAGARLSHHGIVRIYARGEFQGRSWIAQELVPGSDSMADFISEKRDQVCPRPRQYFEAVARVMAAVADAMDHAHRNGVVHRDLKPANILLTKGYRPKVVDFGVAQVAEESDRCSAYERVGTLYYMSPEHLTEALPVDARSDIFSLGTTLYEGLTLTKPFHGGEKEEITRRILTADPVEPRHRRATVPAELAAICMKCLQKDPARRYASMRELAEDLRRFVSGEPVHARNPGALSRATNWMRRNPLRVAAGAGALAVAAAAGWLARGAV